MVSKVSSFAVVVTVFESVALGNVSSTSPYVSYNVDY